MTDNALKAFLNGCLPESYSLHEGEVIVDAVVIFRVLDLAAEGDWAPERFDYTTSLGCSFAMARGMVLNAQDDLGDYLSRVPRLGEED